MMCELTFRKPDAQKGRGAAKGPAMNESPPCTKSSSLIGAQDCQLLSSPELSVGRDPEKNGLKIRTESWRKRSGERLGFGDLPGSPCPLLGFRETSSYCSPPKLHSYSLPPSPADYLFYSYNCSDSL